MPRAVSEEHAMLLRPQAPKLSDRPCSAAVSLVLKQTAARPKQGGLAAGGDKTTENRSNREKVEAYVEERRRLRLPLPANPRRPDKVSMIYVAQEAGVAKEVLLRKRSKLRGLVERAAAELGVAVGFEAPSNRELRWTEALQLCISELRRRNDEEGAPLDNGVPALRRFFDAVRRLSGPDRTQTASECVQIAKEVPIRRLPPRSRDLLDFVEQCLKQHLASDGLPGNFAGALSLACRRAGLTLTALASNVGAKPQTVINWAAGRKNPSEGMLPVVRCIEGRLRVEGKLVPLIKTGRLGTRNIPIREFPHGMRNRRDARRRAKVARRLPCNYLFLPSAERQRAMRDAVGTEEHEQAQRRPRAENYGIHRWPPRLAAEWKDLKRFKFGIEPGPDARQHWTSGGAKKWHDSLSQTFGFAVSQAAGRFRLSPHDLSFALLANPEFLDMMTAHKGARTATRPDEPNVTHTDVDVFTLAAAFFDVGGWGRKNGHIRSRCGHGRSSDKDWMQHCDSIVARLKGMEKKWRGHARRHARNLTRHKSVLPILEMEEPMIAVRLLAYGLEREWRSASETHLRAKLLQDLIYVIIQSQCAFRPGTTVRITYRRDGRGHLFSDDQGRWVLKIPKELFKNRAAEALQDDFTKVLEDEWSLYDLLEEFTEDGRFVLLDGTRTDALFVYGIKEIRRLATHPDESCLEDRNNRRELALAQRVRAFTARHLRWDESTGSGIRGITEFSPTGFRHILATNILKLGGDYQEAADAIADNAETVRLHYAHYRPSDRAGRVRRLVVEGVRSATQGAVEFLKQRRAAGMPMSSKAQPSPQARRKQSRRSKSVTRAHGGRRHRHAA